MVYFLQYMPGWPITIGCSRGPREFLRRMGEHEAFKRRRLEILGLKPGYRKEEAETHRRFAHLRLGTTCEEFIAGPDLLAYIGAPQVDCLVHTQREEWSEARNRRIRKFARLVRSIVEKYASWRVVMHVGRSLGYSGVQVNAIKRRAAYERDWLIIEHVFSVLGLPMRLLEAYRPEWAEPAPKNRRRQKNFVDTVDKWNSRAIL